MKVKLLRELLVGDAEVIATRAGTVVDMDDARARELEKRGLVEIEGAKAAPVVENKKASEPANKARK